MHLLRNFTLLRASALEIWNKMACHCEKIRIFSSAFADLIFRTCSTIFEILVEKSPAMAMPDSRRTE